MIKSTHYVQVAPDGRKWVSLEDHHQIIKELCEHFRSVISNKAAQVVATADTPMAERAMEELPRYNCIGWRGI